MKALSLSAVALLAVGCRAPGSDGMDGGAKPTRPECFPYTRADLDSLLVVTEPDGDAGVAVGNRCYELPDTHAYLCHLFDNAYVWSVFTIVFGANGEPALVTPFIAPTLTLPICVSDAGPPGAECDSPAECQSMLCVQIGMQQGHCSVECPDGECPEPLTCRQGYCLMRE